MSDTTNLPAWKVEFNRRLEAFAKVTRIELDKVFEAFAQYGADGSSEISLTMLESDSTTPIGDLFEMFVDSGLTKKGLVRAGMPHLRGKTHLGETDETVSGNDKFIQAISSVVGPIAGKPVSSYSLKELIDAYGEDTTEVWKVLRDKVHSRRCIIYNRDLSINKEVSLVLAKVAMDQDVPEKWEVSGRLVYVYRPGEFPARPLEESPLYPGVALINGICPKSNADWSKVSKTMRILARLVYQIDGMADSIRERKALYKDASRMSEEEFRSEYKEAALLYDDLSEKNELPNLVVVQTQKVTANIDSPFVVRGGR